MKTIFLALSAAAAIALAAAPADARKRDSRHHHYSHSYQEAPAHYAGSRGYRGYADPSFGNRAGINRAYASGRCVQDLGYGRFRYCGW